MECVILAGGMGTRLRSVVSNVPKCMAPVAGKPFLHYQFETLEKTGFSHVILSLGYKHQIVEDWVSSLKTKLQITPIVENQPLGTGGGIRLALTLATEPNIFILNGDSFLRVDFEEMMKIHISTNAVATLALKEMHNFDRFGLVELNSSHQITAFKEKQFCHSGLINGGIYILQKKSLKDSPERFSLEHDFFEKKVKENFFAGFITSGYFTDIGTPEDYAKAQSVFSNFHQLIG